MNLTLAVANPTQIRNGITKLFGESGKPELARNGKTVEENRAETVDPGIIPGGIRDRAMRSSENESGRRFLPSRQFSRRSLTGFDLRARNITEVTDN